MALLPKIFVVHGRDNAALKSLLRWLARRQLSIETITFDRLAVPGETIPAELERIALLGDAAMILITPDDLGRLKVDPTEKLRARQNVWLEVGWFWARLGLPRTLLLVKDQVPELPSDISGVLYLPFRNLRDISRKLEDFLNSLTRLQPGAITEVVRVATDSGKRSWEYDQVFAAAQRKVVTTGVGMLNFRQQLPSRITDMVINRPKLKLEFLILDKHYVSNHAELFTATYRPNLYHDLQAFERDLSSLLKQNPMVRNRVLLYRYKGIMSFVATIADPPQWGSLMLVETVLPADGSGLVERPRILLRRRFENGLYDRYWRAIKAMQAQTVAGKI